MQAPAFHEDAPVLLIGMFDSPFVRPVAVSLKLLGIPFEHANWSVGKDYERIREFNPLVRVPTLVLDDGTALVECAAMLDYLDDQVGPTRALLPDSGRERRDALQIAAIAVGAAEKGRDQIYEQLFRPAEKRHEPWLARCRA
jgi:glutathione S-transferase